MNVSFFKKTLSLLYLFLLLLLRIQPAHHLRVAHWAEFLTSPPVAGNTHGTLEGAALIFISESIQGLSTRSVHHFLSYPYQTYHSSERYSPSTQTCRSLLCTGIELFKTWAAFFENHKLGA